MSELAVETAEEAAEPTGVEAGVETGEATGAAEAPTVETPASTPGTDWDNIDTLREAAARLQALGYEITPAQQQALEQPNELEYDPYDPQSLLKVIEASPLGQALQQVLQAEQQRQSQQVDTQVNTAIQTVRTELGFTDTTVPDEHIYALGNQLAAQATQGLPDYVVAQRAEQIANDSIKQAVAFFQARDKARDEAAVEAYKQSLTEGGSTLLDPAIVGAGVPGQADYKDEMDFARNYRFTQTT